MHGGREGGRQGGRATCSERWRRTQMEGRREGTLTANLARVETAAARTL
jgi:hypothetical protein